MLTLPVVAAITAPANVSLGSAITNPRAITGAWEQRIALGQVVGFDIELHTVGETQDIDYIWIATYVRNQGHSQRTFWSTQVPAQFAWQRSHLVLHEPAMSNETPPVALDVTFNPKKSEWAGRLQNAWYAGNVRLTRPFVPHIGYRIIGDWIWGGGGGYSCKHIALGSDSALVIWTDINISGNSAGVWYGDMDMDPEMKDIGTNMLFFTGTDLSGDVVLGKVTEDGNEFDGQSAHFGNGESNGTFNPMKWRRTRPDCSNSLINSSGKQKSR